MITSLWLHSCKYLYFFSLSLKWILGGEIGSLSGFIFLWKSVAGFKFVIFGFLGLHVSISL